jgi:hypothetical protein
MCIEKGDGSVGKKLIMMLICLYSSLWFCATAFGADTYRLTESGKVYEGECQFHGFLLGTDAQNDPSITIYDGIDNDGEKIIPTCKYDAGALGLNGALLSEKVSIECSQGIYVEISTTGTCEVIVIYTPKE